MKFTCDKCSAQYMISDEKVGPNGVRVRCKKCGNVVVVRRPPPAAPEPVAEVPQPAPAAASEGGLDDELGAAFDNVFGGGKASSPAPEPEKAPEAPAPDLASTQMMTAEETARVTGGAPAPAATDWYVAIGDAQVGPLPLAEVKRKWEGGDVGPDSLVWRPGMADWAPLSTLADLAAYLAPVPRASARNTVVREEPRRIEAEPVVAAPKREVSWKPAGASALRDLAEKELSTPAEPAAARPGASGTNGAARSSLLDAMNLPDSGVDPTGVFDLPIKGVERTGEQPKAKRESGLARDVAAVREKRTLTRAIVGGVAAAVVLVGAVAAFMFWYFDRQLDRVAVATAPAAAPAQSAPAPAPSAPAPAPAEAAPAQVQPPAEPAPTPAEAPAVASTQPAPAEAKDAPAPAKPAAAPEPKAEQKPVAAAPKPPARTEPTRPARREPARTAVRETPRPPPEPVASAAPAKTRQTARNDSLDFGANDDALVEALGGGGGTGRSVYVPPKPGGTSGLPTSLSPAQINEAVASRVDALRRCVAEQKAREPDASGVIKMQWTIMADGSARNVRCVTPEYAKSPFAACIGNVVKGIRFPRSATTGQEVTFPFSF